MNAREPPADGVADARVSAPTIIARGFRALERYTVELRHADGTRASFAREVLHVGRVVGVLALDVERNELVLIRQFRIPAHLSCGKGDLVEIVAGHVEAGEETAAAARRECLEEIGVAPASLHELFTFMPAPGINDETATLFLATVDAARIPQRAGSRREIEHTRPFRVEVEAALAALAHDKVHNGYLIIALQWLALNRHRLPEIIGHTRE